MVKGCLRTAGLMTPLAVFTMLAVLPVLSLSCSLKRIEIPLHEEAHLREELAKRKRIKSIESVFSIEFEKDGSLLNGDAVLRLGNDKLDLQVYSHGLLALDIMAEGSTVRSAPPLDGISLRILVDGIRAGFLWWSHEDYSAAYEGGRYVISDSSGDLYLNSRTLMPEEKTISPEDGWRIRVFYDEPVQFGGIRYPSGMRMKLANYLVRLKIETIAFTGY